MPPFAGSRDDISPGVSSGANSAPAVNNSNQLPPTDMPSGVTDSGTTDPHGSSSGQGYLKATITHNELVEDPGEPFSFARLPIAAPGDAVSGAPDAHRSFGEEVGRILNAAPDLGNAVLGGARNVASFYSLSPEEQDRLIEDFVDTYGTGLQAIQKDPSAAAQIYVRTVSNMTNDAPQIAAMEGAGSMVNALGKGGELTDIIVNAMAKNDKLAGVVRKFGKRYFPTSGATPKEVEIINDFVDDTGLKPGIRATDPVSAYRTQQATNRGVSAKPFTIKENTKLGTMEKELPSGVVKEYRGDLDIAYVYDPKRGRLLTDIETLTEVVGPLNKRLRKAGLKPSFRHGGHATASEAKNIKTWKDLMEIPASPGPVIEHAGKDLAGNYTKPQLMTSDDVLRMFARKRRGPALPDKLGD